MNKSYLTIPLQIKKLTDREFEGYGSVFDNEDLGGDIVLPGAFKRTLAEHRKDGSLPQMFWMHDPSRIPGKWLSMSEDDDGLKVKGTLADTPLGNEVHTLLEMDAVRGLSIGYETIKQTYDDDGHRQLSEIKLWEVSVVSLPMNPLAQVAHVKSQLSAAGEYVPTPREFERTLRDVGCSQMVAKRIMSKIFEDERVDDADKSAHPLNSLEDRMVDAAAIVAMSKIFECGEDDLSREVMAAKRIMSKLSEDASVNYADLSSQVTDLLEDQMVNATMVAAMSKIFECEDPSREVLDSTRDVEVDKDKEPTRDVEASKQEIEDEQNDIARAAHMVAESMFAATIKVPRI